MLAEATALMLVAGTALYVAQPLFSSTISSTISNAIDESLEDQKLEIYESLRDLDYDRQMRKVSSDDYEQLRQQLTDEALALLSQLDSKARPGEVRDKDPLEEEIAQYRAHRRAPKVTRDSTTCPRCNRSQSKESRFCGHCGVRLELGSPEDDSEG